MDAIATAALIGAGSVGILAIALKVWNVIAHANDAIAIYTGNGRQN